MNKIVRSKTKATGGITPEEKDKLGIVAQKWIDIAMRTAPIEPDKIGPAIKGLYAAAGLKEPRIVIAPSPLVMAFAYGAAAWIWHCRKNGRIATRAATDAATRAATRAATDAATDAASSVCRELAGQAGIACAKNWNGVYQGGNMWAGWCAHVNGMHDVIGLDLPEYAVYKYYEDAAMHGGLRVMHEEFCIVSDFPEVLKKDEQNRPHCEDGPSHRWRDGWSLYHWHGVRVPDEWIEDKASLDPKTALAWPNIEQRRAACEIVGWARITKELDAATLDEDDDPEIGTLFEAEIPDSGKERFLQVRCGTGREFVIPVPREMKTALQANAWTYGLESYEYKPEIRT